MTRPAVLAKSGTGHFGAAGTLETPREGALVLRRAPASEAQRAPQEQFRVVFALKVQLGSRTRH